MEGAVFLKKVCKILVVLLMFSLVGCAASNKSKTTKKPVDSRVAIVDVIVARKLPVIDVIAHTRPDGLMEVQVTGRNYTSRYYKLEYKAEWLDKNGFVIKTILSRWTAFPAYEQSEYMFKAVAPKAVAVDFRIKIRKGE